MALLVLDGGIHVLGTKPPPQTSQDCGGLCCSFTQFSVYFGLITLPIEQALIYWWKVRLIFQTENQKKILFYT